MAKIDRLGWATGITGYAYGLRIGIRVSTPEVLDEVQARLPIGWEPGCSPIVDHLYSLKVGGVGARAGARNFHLLYAGLTQLARTLELQHALDALESDLHMHVANFARNRVFIHAGAVGWRGKAILIPGRCLSGKSTLVTALLRAGANFYSDEFAVLDGNGALHPFPRRLSLRRPSGPPRRPTAEELGAKVGVTPLPVAMVVLTQYQADARWQPRRVSAGQAALEVMQSTMPTIHDPEVALSMMHKVIPGALCLKGPRGDANQTARDLLERLA
jgi:hypothetical protein